MINVDNNFFNNFNILLDKQSIEIIQQNLENCDEGIFKNYKIDENLKNVNCKCKCSTLLKKNKVLFIL